LKELDPINSISKLGNKMDSHGGIEMVAYELYEISGRVDGRGMENWLEAERIVKAIHTSHDLTTKVNLIEEKAQEFMRTAEEVMKATLHELGILTKKVFK
jgi:hypothetical protein